ncbi:MAG: molybdopterin molybdenumtransferase MoeA [Proteobacteria bacterium]|nr:MAG: molybdopterin molybdenumtransferase MoeA [Pseudomonadota bacterium]
MHYEPASCDQMPNHTLTVEQAQARILQQVQPLQVQERLTLRQAHGRILAMPQHARQAVPPYRNAAMDGYAYYHADLQGEQTTLRIAGSALAGHPFQGALHAGECVRIMTGAMLPERTDTVIMQENTTCEQDLLHLLKLPKQGANVRHPGKDTQVGELLLPAGRKLNAADLGLLASQGITELNVLRRPRVAIFSTGDELKSLGEPLEAGQIYDSNRYTLYALLDKLSVELIDMGIIPDQPDAIEKAFQQAASSADVLITSGGVSVGDADYVTASLQKLGKVHFWKMAMKPGKPLAYGQVGNSLFFGLPGNPVSVMATFMLFVRPALLKLSGHPVTLPVEYPAMTRSNLQKKPGRKEYQRGICSQTPEGSWQVKSTGIQESHLLHSMSQANCFIVLAQETGHVPAASPVKIILFDDLL